MQLLPVIDILHGVAVRGIAGRRNEYRPLTTPLADSADPVAVARGMRQTFGFRRFYVADLDGILARRPNFLFYQRLHSEGFELLLDAGIRTGNDAGELMKSGATMLIGGLESLAGPAALKRLIAEFGFERIVFSLDLQQGRPLLPRDSSWEGRDPRSIAQEAVACGVRKIIVLDLADVGTGSGGSTSDLCRELRQHMPDLHIIAGGGVRGEDDVRNGVRCGISELLVASALHDGRLSPDFVREFV